MQTVVAVLDEGATVIGFNSDEPVQIELQLLDISNMEISVMDLRHGGLVPLTDMALNPKEMTSAKAVVVDKHQMVALPDGKLPILKWLDSIGVWAVSHDGPVIQKNLSRLLYSEPISNLSPQQQGDQPAI